MGRKRMGEIQKKRCADCVNYLGDKGDAVSSCILDGRAAYDPMSFDNTCSDFKLKNNQPIRTFNTGATRDTDQNKPNYIKALSPIVLDCFVDYLGRHRKQSDGSVRDWDNWKSGIPKEVYLESQDRHHRAVWKLCHGFPASDNHGPVTLKDSLCGVIFNAMGHLHEILKEEMGGQNDSICRS